MQLSIQFLINKCIIFTFSVDELATGGPSVTSTSREELCEEEGTEQQ